jgi:7-cyano-7-deazaguanine synthase
MNEVGSIMSCMKKKAIVLLSGGQDSATCLAIAKQKFEEIHCICFDYGQRHRIEIECSKVLAKRGNATFECIDITFVKDLSQSALVTETIKIKDDPNSLPNTFVPGRNALFLTLASMIAYEKKCTTIFTGVCQTDYSGYPDCRQDFIKSQQQTISLALDRSFKIETPLMYLTKKETVLMMQKLELLEWYKDTHTCYEGSRPACGKCPACKLRLAGFKQANVKDPIRYK